MAKIKNNLKFAIVILVCSSSYSASGEVMSDRAQGGWKNLDRAVQSLARTLRRRADRE